MKNTKFQIGHVPFNKGKHLKKETRDKISQNNARYWLGKKMPKEIGAKISRMKLGKPRNITWGDNISKALKGHKPFNNKKHTAESIMKIKNNTVAKADMRIMKEIKEFESQGFRCVPTGGKIRPDFIAIKDNKLFAVEVEYGRPNYLKYTKEMMQYVDDVIWIIKRKRNLNDYDSDTSKKK